MNAIPVAIPRTAGRRAGRRRLRLLGLMLAAVAVGGLLTAAAPDAARAAPYCGITWGSLPRTGGEQPLGPLLEVRTGQHECWDRVVVETDRALPGDGYSVRYGEPYTEGQGLAMTPYTAGGAVLAVSLMAPAYRDDGTVTFPRAPGEHLATVIGYQTLRDVVYGGSFEGYSTFAIGVRATLPFTVFTLAGPGTHSRLVIDIAHRWEQ